MIPVNCDQEQCHGPGPRVLTDSVSWVFSFRLVLVSEEYSCFVKCFFPFPALLVPCNWLLLNQTAEVAQLYPTEEMFHVTCTSLCCHCDMEVMPILNRAS